MKLTDKRIIEFLEKKHQGSEFNLEKFINVTSDDLRSTKNFKNLPEIADKIKKYVSEKKKILIYGDYDSDGICASTILYLYLNKIGADVDVFIPNRFENGYGISVDAIEEITSTLFPDLIITVDLGITAVEEVEILKQEGIDIVITDHHMPLEEIPDCLVADLKYNSDSYGFDALCGAGVAYKLVEAMAGREEANSYLDLCAVATIGDIVPLVDENRIIAKLGLEKINQNECLKSISFMLKSLGLEKITSTDISFKIVPRLNACGRMDNARKVFDFLIETDERLLKQKYAEIEKDNSFRCECIDKGILAIENMLKSLDFAEPAIVIKGNFHEGVIGILASRLARDYSKPTLVFTQTEDGTLKASGRSVEGVDIHKIISEMGDMLVNFGGHKMAVGVEIENANFDEFKRIFNQKIQENVQNCKFLINNSTYDIEISDHDFSTNFLAQLDLLEPFGCENEKPILMIRQGEMFVEGVSERAFKHYKCLTSGGNKIMAFGGYNYVPLLRSKSQKKLIVELSENSYNNKTTVNGILRHVIVENPVLAPNSQDDNLASIYNKYYSIFEIENREKYHLVSNPSEIILQKFNESEFGTLVVATTSSDLDKISALGLSKYYCSEPYPNGQNAVLLNPRSIYSSKNIKGYKNIIFLHHYFDEEHLHFTSFADTYESQEKFDFPVKLSKDRQVFSKVYNLVLEFGSLQANDVLDMAQKLSFKDRTLSPEQILFCLIVFYELNFLDFDDTINRIVMLKSKKMELSSSKVYNILE